MQAEFDGNGCSRRDRSSPLVSAWKVPVMLASAAAGTFPRRITHVDQRAGRNNLDAVRLFLALNVAIGHGCSYWFRFEYRYGMAVSMFLGISGYLVLQSRYNSVSAGHFVWKRFLRIYPLMIATVCIGSYWLDRQVSQVAVYLLTAGLTGDSLIGPGWTIIVEEAMYGLMLALFQLDAYKKPWLIASLGAVSVTVVMAVYFVVAPEIQRIIILPANFFFGNLLYLQRRSLAPYYRVLTVPCACIGFGYMLSSFPVDWPAPAHLLFHMLAQFMGIVACIGIGIHARPVFGWLRNAVGDLSYSVYLIHSLLLAWFLGHPLSSNVMTFAGFLGASLTLALVSWRLIEHPSLQLRDVPA